MLKIIKLILIFGILYYLFKGVDFFKLIESFKNYSYFYSILAMLSVILSDFLLSFRWKVLSQNKLSMFASFEIIAVGAFFNFFAPAKLGEVSKVFYAKKIYNCKISKMTAVLIFERAFDVLMLAFVALLGIIFYFDFKIYSYISFIFLIIFFFFLFLNVSFGKKLFYLLPFKRIRRFLYKVFLYLKHIGSFSLYFKTLILTLFVWTSYIFTFFIFINGAMMLDFNFTQIFMIFIISSVAMSIPLAPGGVGTFQAGIVFAFSLFNVQKEEALIAGLLLHVFMLIPSTILAIFIFSKRDIKNANFSI